jgi:hypothetical protein
MLIVQLLEHTGQVTHCCPIKMDFLGYHIILPAVLVTVLVSIKIRFLLQNRCVEGERHWIPARSRSSDLAEFRMPPSGHYCAMAWSRLMARGKVNRMIRAKGTTLQDQSFELLMEPCRDQSLCITGYRHGCDADPGAVLENCYLSLLPGMHAVLILDETGSSHLVCGASGGFKADCFLKDADSVLAIENLLRPSQSNELRLHYKHHEPSLNFTSVATLP